MRLGREGPVFNGRFPGKGGGPLLGVLDNDGRGALGTGGGPASDLEPMSGLEDFG